MDIMLIGTFLTETVETKEEDCATNSIPSDRHHLLKKLK